VVKLEIANPVAESVVPKIDPAARPADLAGRRIGLYWNYKPGGNVGLDRVERMLGERYPTAKFLRFQGSVGASVKHITPKDADQIARECEVVVGTTGD
jgi:hypothetical protein